MADADIARLQALLDALPAPLAPLDMSALDGYLCGVILQPRSVPAAKWLPWVSDVEGRAPPGRAPHPALTELQELARRRHAELLAAIDARQWFDPWVFDIGPGAQAGDDATDNGTDIDDDTDSDPAAAVRPWVAGFATAMSVFPELMDHPALELIEPLALIFMHFDPAELEDADTLLEVIETLEPPKDLAEAVQDLVRAVMLAADVTRPRAHDGPPARSLTKPRRGARNPSGAAATLKHRSPPSAYRKDRR
jgi:uncharacterized protein